jgi:type I site-specific restriction endonuclease
VKIEGGLTYNQLQKRSDILVFDREGKPWMVIECKSPDLKVSQSTLQQASVYNATLRAKYLTVSNGLTHYCASTDWEAGKTTLLEALPVYT